MVITSISDHIDIVKAVIGCFTSDQSIPMYWNVKRNSSVRLNLSPNSLNKASGFIYCLNGRYKRYGYGLYYNHL